MKEEALDRTPWTAGFGRDYGTVVRQTMQRNECRPRITCCVSYCNGLLRSNRFGFACCVGAWRFRYNNIARPTKLKRRITIPNVLSIGADILQGVLAQDIDI